MTKPKLKKPALEFVYPALKRSADDYEGALSAFHRLYLYGRSKQNPVIAILAVFKGLQKLEQEYGYDIHEQMITGELAPCPLPAPQWLREGIWLCLETFLAKPMIPGIEGKTRPQSFGQVLSKHLQDYTRWSERFLASLEGESTDASKGLEGSGLSERTSLRSFNRIQSMIDAANQLACEDAKGNTLAYVEPRDLVPTGRFAKIYRANLSPSNK